MLVMTRRIDESILVNRDIEITVVEIRGDKVRLGITAPKEVPVHRREVFEAIYGPDQLDSAAPAGERSAKLQEAAAISSLRLSDAHLSLLDRLCESCRAASGELTGRDQVLATILSAIQDAEEAVGEPASLDQLQSTLSNAIKATTASK